MRRYRTTRFFALLRMTFADLLAMSIFPRRENLSLSSPLILSAIHAIVMKKTRRSAEQKTPATHTPTRSWDAAVSLARVET